MSVRTVCSFSLLKKKNSNHPSQIQSFFFVLFCFFAFHWMCDKHAAPSSFRIWFSRRPDRCTDVTMQQYTRKKCKFNCAVFIFRMYICISNLPSSRKGLFQTVLYFHFMICGGRLSVFSGFAHFKRDSVVVLLMDCY